MTNRFIFFFSRHTLLLFEHAFMIPFLLGGGHQIREAIDHHRGLGNDADNDADDVHFGRDESVGEEVPDGIKYSCQFAIIRVLILL